MAAAAWPLHFFQTAQNPAPELRSFDFYTPKKASLTAGRWGSRAAVLSLKADLKFWEAAGGAVHAKGEIELRAAGMW